MSVETTRLTADISGAQERRLGRLASRKQQLAIIDRIFQKGFIRPGEIVRRSRFDSGYPFIPVDVNSSLLVALYNDGSMIDALFVEHQISVPDDDEHSLERLYEERNSLRNGIGWTGARERVGVRRFSWSIHDTHSSRSHLNETLLGVTDTDFSRAIATYHRLKWDQDAKAAIDQAVSDYKREIIEMSEGRVVALPIPPQQPSIAA